MKMTQHDLFRIKEGTLMDAVEEANMFFSRVSKKLIEDFIKNKDVTVSEKAKRYSLYTKIKDLKFDFSYEDDALTVYYRQYRELVVSRRSNFQKGDRSFFETIEAIQENVLEEAKGQTLINPKEFYRVFSKLKKSAQDFMQV